MDWDMKLGYSTATLAEMNRKTSACRHEIRNEYKQGSTRMVISGCIGPCGDRHNVALLMPEDDAERYHVMQAQTFREAKAGMVTAITMTYTAEAIGLTQAARAADIPVMISFTIETNGRLPTGQTVQEAIEQVDDATGQAPLDYMINCAHPRHFADTPVVGATVA
jgi:S-methylmethionine-dependent homocysteine/selenocysteine methylase